MLQTRGVSLDSAVSTVHKRGCGPTDVAGLQASVDVKELRDLLHRELQECTSGQQQLQAEVKQHKQFVQEWLTRVERTLAELCEELPQLREQCLAQTREISRIGDLQNSCSRRAEELERGLAEESEARYDAERAHNSDLLGWGNHVAARVETLEVAVVELRRQQQQQQQQQRHDSDEIHAGQNREPDQQTVALVEQQTRAVIALEDAHGSNEGASINCESSCDREIIDPGVQAWMQDVQRENMAQINDLENRITEEWTGLRGWVDAAVVAVVNRISTLECSLKFEIERRQTTNTETGEAMSKQWRQLEHLQNQVAEIGRFQSAVRARSREEREDNCGSAIIPDGTLSNGAQRSGSAVVIPGGGCNRPALRRTTATASPCITPRPTSPRSSVLVARPGTQPAVIAVPVAAAAASAAAASNSCTLHAYQQVGQAGSRFQEGQQRRWPQQQQQQHQQAKRSVAGSAASPPSPVATSAGGNYCETGRGLSTSRSESSSRPRTPNRVRQVVLNDRARRCAGGPPTTA